ncbi:hypothetical protein BO94DRAFT_544972 [Aspergillus sclerotioniger CBS 115572]|uniref:Uncharacterized protein n=1 Tax=Aspergillus sclerotioniger CBS 115572 TaxID=1450535 RepID=A0A317X016_9EURO|nr:hypothetical protein BO94DRAFT_544972 [Aspergillus sclerotioniger CBS 115572]PWY91615.1 hypothetical protein BO94DRAFT_544972 [Aspergillus sclerotioniger CBS 115572]
MPSPQNQPPHNDQPGSTTRYSLCHLSIETQPQPSSSMVMTMTKPRHPPSTDPIFSQGEPPSPPPDTPRPFHTVATDPDPELPVAESFDDHWADELLQSGWLVEDKTAIEEGYYPSPPATVTKIVSSGVKRKARVSVHVPSTPTPMRMLERVVSQRVIGKSERRKRQRMVAVEVSRPRGFNPEEYEELQMDEMR